MAKKTAAPKTAAKKAELTDVVIGDAAGEVWRLLTENDELTLAAIKKAADNSGDTTLMAIGWLAREGKLRFETKGRSIKVKLA